jgi:hypothetical protein
MHPHKSFAKRTVHVPAEQARHMKVRRVFQVAFFKIAFSAAGANRA